MYSFAAARGCALGRPPVRGGGGRGPPKESLSRGVLLKSSLTHKILSFHFHDRNQSRENDLILSCPNSFHFTYINGYLKTFKVIELRIILKIR